MTLAGRALRRVDALADRRAAGFERFDRPFANHPAMTLLHVVPGGMFLALDFTLLSAAFSAEAVFVMSLWTGWTITVGVAAMWIRSTRREVRSAGPGVAGS